MKLNKIIYWITTAIAILLGAVPATMYFNNPMMIDGFHHLGFPDYFRIELAIGKIIGAIFILLPMIPTRLKEWSYTAFGIAFISAAIAIGITDGSMEILSPIIAFIFLVVSYIYFHKLNKK